MALVLVVEADPLLGRLLVQLLRGDGHRARVVAPGQPLLEEPVDAAVVTTAHPAVLQRLRAAGVPLLLVSAARASAAGTPVLVRPPARALLSAVREAVGERVRPGAGSAARLPLAG